jgi:hypothetical protein
MKVRLSGGPSRQRFVISKQTMTKASVTKLLEPFGIEVIQNCKDCEFIIIPDEVNEASKTAKHATHNHATTIKITNFLRMIKQKPPQQKRKTVKSVKTAQRKKRITKKKANHRKPQHNHKTRND